MTSLPRSTPAVVLGVALLMLLTTTGGAVAGSLITSKQIKDNTITSADIKNKTITKADLAPSTQGLQGIQGIQGPQGVQGQTGPRGLSAWDTIPSGVTVTGGLFVDTSTTGAGSNDSYWVSLPGRAPVDLTGATVNFAPSSFAVDDDATCTGNALAPTAPAGKVCIYLGSSGVVGSMQGLVSGLPKTGFIISWFPTPATQGQDLFFQASWAYTAP